MASAAAEAPEVPQLTQEQKQENAQSGIYYADSNTKIVCFGDLEGTSLRKLINPGRASTISETGVLKNTVSNLTELYGYLTVDSEGKLILQQNVILVCLGDVIGDGPDNIELATTLLNLKHDNPTRVILIIGNRDLNKIRLGWELAPTDACMTELRTKVDSFVGSKSATAFANFKFEFKRNDPADFNYLWSNNHKLISERSTSLDRVIQITEGSMGEYYAWVFLVDEYLTNRSFTPEQLKGISDEVKSYIYVYLVQAMSGAIDCDVSGFNGIFEKLLRAGHLMACIDADNRGKFGFMHSLPPRGKIPTTPGFIYKEQYDAGILEVGLTDKDIETNKTVAKVKDSDITSANKVEINEGLREFNQSLRTLIETYRGGTPEVLRELLELVSAVTTGSYWLYKNNNRISGANMPVSTVSFGSGFGQFEAASDITVQGGGGIEQLKQSIATRYIDIKDFTHVVCSHSPKGYVGVKVRTSDGKFYYCVDVSKIDDQEYDVKERFGCCFLIFDLSKISADGNVNDKFIGRIMLKQSQFPTDYAIFANKPIKGTMFAHGNPMFANYVLGSPIPTSTKKYMEQRLPLKIGNTDYVFEYINGGKEKRNFERKSGSISLDYFTKLPTLTAAAGGGSRTRKRRSRYLKRSARTTHKRRHISKKHKNNNNKRKDKKSKRSSTAR
jgi:hypothetical protein